MSVNLKEALNNPGGMLQWAIDNIYQALGGEALGGVMVGGSILVTFYLAGGRSFATPAVVLMLIGGVLLQMLPGGMAQVGTTIMLLGLVASILALAERYFIPTPR